MTDTAVSCDFSAITEMIDKFLAELGTQSIVDGDKARDQLLDLRSQCEKMQFEEVVDELRES